MATVLERIENVRHKLSCTESEISNDELLASLDNRYLPLSRKFVLSKREGFQGRRKINIQNGVDEYVLPLPNAEADTEQGEVPFGIGDVQKVYIDYGNGYIKATELKDSLTSDPYDYLATNASQGCPYYKIFNQATMKIIEVYPTPTSDVTNGLKIIGNLKPHSLRIDDKEDRILIPDEFQYLLEYALYIDVMEHRKEDNKAVLAEQKFDKKVTQALNEWKRGVYRVITSSKNKNLSRFEI